MPITFTQFFPNTATTSRGIEFLDFLRPTIATLEMAVPSEWAGVRSSSCILSRRACELTCMGLRGDTAHPADHSSVIALQAIQIIDLRTAQVYCFAIFLTC